MTKKRALLTIEKGVKVWPAKGALISVHYGEKGISIGPGLLPAMFITGIVVRRRTLVRHPVTKALLYKGNSLQLLPALSIPVQVWPEWYKKAFEWCSWSNHTPSRELKKEAR